MKEKWRNWRRERERECVCVCVTEREKESAMSEITGRLLDVSHVRGAGSGVMLQKYTWRAKTKKPKAYIVAVHGHAVHARFEFLLPSSPGGKHEVYEGSWIASLNDAGYEFVSFDLPSHGESEDVRGTRCYFDKFDDLAMDAIGVVEGVRKTIEEKVRECV